MSRDALEELETGDLDLGVTIAWLVREDVGVPSDDLSAAVRRAMLVLAAGGDPHRDLGLDDVAVDRLAAELDAPERRAALDRALAGLETGGLPRVAEAVKFLRSEPELAWQTLALAFLADELAEG